MSLGKTDLSVATSQLPPGWSVTYYADNEGLWNLGPSGPVWWISSPSGHTYAVGYADGVGVPQIQPIGANWQTAPASEIAQLTVLIPDAQVWTAATWQSWAQMIAAKPNSGSILSAIKELAPIALVFGSMIGGAALLSSVIAPTAAATSTGTATALGTGEATAAGTGGTVAAAAPTASVVAAPVETATIAPVSSADISTLTAEGFPTSAIASPLTSTGTASAVSTAAEAATSSPTSLLTSGAGLLKQAAPAIAAGTALVKKIFGTQTAPVTTGAYVPAQRRINPLFIGAGILLLAVAVKKGGGRKGKHHEPRTDFIR